MKHEFTVVSSNPTEKGTFVTKMRHETRMETPFGIKVAKRTLYVSGAIQLKADDKLLLEMDEWEIKEYPFSFTDEKTGEVKDISIKYLHIKSAVA